MMLTVQLLCGSTAGGRLTKLPPVLDLFTSRFSSQRELQKDAVEKLLSDAGFRREVGQQAARDVSSFPYASRQRAAGKSELIVHATGTLNPLSPAGKCEAVRCRVKNARTFAASLGIYADQ